MICQEALEWISQDVDGLVEEAVSERLRQHLAECASCRKVRQDFQTNRVLMRSLSPMEVPEGAWGRLLQKIVSQPPQEAPAEVPALSAVEPAQAAVVALKPRRGSSLPVRVFQAVAAMLVVFLGGLTMLGWNDNTVLDTTASTGDPGAVIQGHALAQSSDPLNDRARWHYLATEPREVNGAQAIYQPASMGAPSRGPLFPADYAVPASFTTTTTVGSGQP